jgi:hypothetical protein
MVLFSLCVKVVAQSVFGVCLVLKGVVGAMVLFLLCIEVVRQSGVRSFVALK